MATQRIVTVNLETGEIDGGAPTDHADLSLAMWVLKRKINNARTLVNVDGLCLWAPPTEHDAIKAFMGLYGGQEWVTHKELTSWCSSIPLPIRKRTSLPPSMEMGMPVIEALEKLFHAEPANFDDKYNRPGAKPE